ncbi:MAG TPA: sugar phosphate isomerase/epimerase family protein [Terriglobia bacterium]|nr:sugar phosphate isomerase/epimerase family protein [Terriglobia bacterium]
MRNHSRREFLKTSSLLAAGAAALNWRSDLFASQPHLSFPTAARDRLAVASWPFRMFIDAPGNKWARDPKLPGMDLKDFGAMVVRKFGLHNIEPLSFHFASTDAAYLAEFRKSTEKAGVRVIDLAVDSPTSLYDPDSAKRHKAVEVTKEWLAIAATVGSPSIRRNLAGPRDVKPDVGRTVESLKEVADFGAEKNVVVNLENDNNFTEDPFFLVEVIEKVSNPYLRALPDFCNSMLTHDQDFNNRALAAMFKHAYNISHVKDSESSGEGKFVTVDVAKSFKIAKAAGYRGYFSMEWEGDGEPYAGTQKLIDLSLKYLS